MMCLPLGVTAGIHNTQGAFTAMHKPALTSRTEMLFATSPATGSPSVTPAFRAELSSMAILIEELDRTDPSPLAMVTEGWSAMTTPVADALRWQVVTPLDWPGEPIPAKVLMIGLKRGRFLGYAVADLEERALKVYSGGHISFQVEWAQGGSITARGDVLIKDGRGGYLVPGGDFTEPSLPVRPSRYVPEREAYAPSVGFVTDPSGSLVWMSQNIYMRHSVYMPGVWPDQEGVRYRIKEKWVDLFNVDTGKIVLTTDIRGDWGMAGALEEGLLLREGHNRVIKVDRYTIDSTVLEEPGRILILRPDGSKHYVTPNLDETPNLDGPAEGWRQGFGILRAYGRHFALLRRDNREMVVVDAETGATYPVPKPSAGTWSGGGLPTIPIESSSPTNSGAFVMGFRSRARGRSLDDWSLYQIRLSDQSVSRIYQHPPHDLPTGYYRGKPALTAKSVANGTAVLAFTGWPVSPDNDAVINVIGPRGELIPVAAVPDDFFILDAS